MATFGFQANHIQELLSAEPFRPFEIYLQGHKQDYRIDDPSDVSWKGDVLVIRYDYERGRRADWVALSSIALITVLGGDGA